MLTRVEPLEYCMGPQQLTLDRDDRLETLADDACRKTVSWLETHDDLAVSLDELAAGMETESAPDDSPSRAVLHHAVLPNLAAADMLEYESSSRTIYYENPDHVEATVATIERLHG